MPTCYLHIGFHKTGTSSVQHFLSRNAKILEKNNYIYPALKLHCKPKHEFTNHSLPFVVGIKGKQPHEAKRLQVAPNATVTKHFLEDLNQLLSNNKNIIFSGEGISHLTLQNFQVINKLVQRNNFQIKLIAVVRSPYSFLCSNIQQQIKTGAKSFNLDRLDKSPEILKTVSSKISKIQKTCIRTSFLAYSDCMSSQHGVMGNLMREFDISDTIGFEFESKTQNQSIGNICTRIQNEANKLNPLLIGDNINPNYYDYTKIDTNSNDGKFLLTKDEYKNIENLILEENNRIRLYLGDNFCDNEICFSRKVQLAELFPYMSLLAKNNR